MTPQRLQKKPDVEIRKFSTGRTHQFLAIEGYIYKWAKAENDCDLYYCRHSDQNDVANCRAAVHFWKNEQFTYLPGRGIHAHGREHDIIKAMEAEEKLKKLGEDNPLGRPRDLISAAIPDSAEVAKILPKKCSLEKLVQRSQLKKRVKIRCTSLEDIDMDAIKLCRTESDQQILAFDTGFSHGVRAIGFSTPHVWNC